MPTINVCVFLFMHKVNIIKSVTIQETYVRKASFHVSVLPLLLQEHVQIGMTNPSDFVFESHYRTNKLSAGTNPPASSILFSFTEHFN